jgi:hypothetical protein
MRDDEQLLRRPTLLRLLRPQQHFRAMILLLGSLLGVFWLLRLLPRWPHHEQIVRC